MEAEKGWLARESPREAVTSSGKVGRKAGEGVQKKILPTGNTEGDDRTCFSLFWFQVSIVALPASLSPRLRLTGLQLLWVLGGFE